MNKILLRKKKREKSLNGVDLDNTILRNIYAPFFGGLSLIPIGLFVGYITNNRDLEVIISFGLSSVIIGLSSYWQIKYKVVPGIPVWRGGYAVIFGYIFLLYLQ